MKKIIIFIITPLISASALKAQTEPPKRDTVRIILGDESITLPLPREGNKVTVNMEDSAEIIQISIGKVSKFRTPALLPPPTAESRKSIRWFSDVEIGTLAMMSPRYYMSRDSAYGGIYTSPATGSDNRVAMIRITPEKALPGFFAGFSIREKRRFIGDSEFEFVSGTRFRYARYAVRGTYDIREIKSELVNGLVKYYPDSVFSIRNGDYRSVTSCFQLLLPFMIEKQVIPEKLKIGVGLNVAVNLTSSRILTKGGENLKSTNFIMTYIEPQFLQLQPTIRAGFKRSSIQVTYTAGRTRMGYGATEYMTARAIYFGFGYKLY